MPKRPSSPPVPAPTAPRTDYEWAQAVENGLPVTNLVAFGREAGFTAQELAHLLHIPPRTYARRVAAKGKLDITEGERAARLMRLYDLAKDFFVTHENTRQWLNASIPALGGRTPLDMARTESGARQVENVIGAITHGIYL